MKIVCRSKHADRVVLVKSEDSGLVTGRRLAAEGATVYAVGLFGEWWAFRSAGKSRSRMGGISR